MRTWTVVLALLATVCAGFGQPAPEVLWTRTFGGPAFDQATWVELTPDGGFILAGFNGAGPHGDSDGWLIKTNAEGNVQWSHFYGGEGYEEFRSVEVLPDGGYLAFGTTNSDSDGGNDMFLVKTNAQGEMVWSRTYGGPADDEGWFARRTPDGGFILAGVTYSFGAGGSDMYLVKTNAEGNVQWSHTYGGPADDRAWTMRLVGDGYCLGGYTESFGAGWWDAYVVRVNGEGDQLWNHVFGGQNRDWFSGMTVTPEGGVVMVGVTMSFTQGWGDGYVAKLSPAGDVQWTRSYGTSMPESWDEAIMMPDGGLFLLGLNQYQPYDFWIMRTNAAGDPIWQRTLSAPHMEWALGVKRTPDGGYVLCGSTESSGNGSADAYLIRLAPDGPPPPPEHHFMPVPPSGLPYAVIVDSARADEEPLHPGDEIGIFDGELCVGAGTLGDGWPLTITAWQGDPEQGLPGFTVGHAMLFRTFTHPANIDAPATPTFSVGDGTFGFGVYSRVSLTSILSVTQTIPLRANYFELISLNVWPHEPFAPHIFGPLEHLVAAYEDNGNVFIPPDIHTLGELHQPEGYRLFTTQAETLRVTGLPLSVFQPYELHPGGWQWISYPRPAPLPIESGMMGVAYAVNIVQDADGHVWIPSEGLNTIGDLIPGKGYMVLVNDHVTFNFGGDASPQSEPRELPPIALPSGAPRPTGLPYAVIADIPSSVKALGAHVIEINDGGLCVGKAFVNTASERTLITTWQGVTEYDLSGFVPGHPISLTVKDADGNVVPVRTVGSTGTFGAGGYAKIQLAGENAIATNFVVSEGYPNPFNPVISFTLNLTAAGPVEFNVFNTLGQRVFNARTELIAGEHRYTLDTRDFAISPVSGMYFVEVRHADASVLRKVLLLR